MLSNHHCSERRPPLAGESVPPRLAINGSTRLRLIERVVGSPAIPASTGQTRQTLPRTAAPDGSILPGTSHQSMPRSSVAWMAGRTLRKVLVEIAARRSRTRFEPVPETLAAR